MSPNELSAFLDYVRGNLSMAWLPALIAAGRGRSFALWFLIALVVPFPASMILAAVYPSGRRSGSKRKAKDAQADRLEALEDEARRMDQAEARRQSGAAAAAPAAARPSLPPFDEAIDALPERVQSNPLADAPRVSLRRAGEPPRPTEAEPGEGPPPGERREAPRPTHGSLEAGQG